MMHFPFEIEIIKFLQSFRSDFLDSIFQFFTLFGEEMIIILLLAVIYFIVDKRFGEFMCFAVLTSLVANNTVKTLFKADRPFLVDSSIENLKPSTSTGYSFPSGHTQASGTTYFSAFAYTKKKWILISAIVITFMVGLSRLYLGVHFLSDVVVAIMLSILISMATKIIFEKFYDKRFLIYLIFATVFLPFVLFTKDEISADLFKMYGMYLGFIVGITLENKLVKFTETKKVLFGILRIVIVGAVVFGFKEGLKIIFPDGNFFNLIRYFFVAFSGLFICPLIFKSLKI